MFQSDWMHTKSLRTDSSLAGSCLLFMATEILPGTIDQNFSLIWAGAQQFYKENRIECRLSRLNHKMVKHTPFPRLSAKAMEIRHLLPALEVLVRAWVGNPFVAYFHRLVTVSCRLDKLVFDNKSFWLTAPEREALREGVFDYNQTLSLLVSHFHKAGKASCNYTIKNHYLLHIGLHAAKTGISPRLAFCYQGKDYMSVIKTLAVGSSRGIESAKLSEKMMPKYIRGLDLLMRQGQM